MRRTLASSRIAAAVFALVAAVTLVRGVDALRGRWLTAAGERAFHPWAAGDPRLDDRLAAAARHLPPAAGVRLLVPAGTDPAWATFRAQYHLPLQQVMGIHHAGGPPPPADAWLIDVTTVPTITPPAR
jgi:hypothetical protein